MKQMGVYEGEKQRRRSQKQKQAEFNRPPCGFGSGLAAPGNTLRSGERPSLSTEFGLGSGDET